MPIRILIIDDHPLFLDGLASVLRRFDDGAQIQSAANAEDGLAAAQAHELDLVVLDLNLPGMDGLTAIGEFHRRFPALPVVVLSSSEYPEDVHRAIHAGALGFIPKTSSTRTLFDALRQVLSGNVYIPLDSTGPTSGQARPVFAEPHDAEDGTLSLRQLEILALLCQGLTNKRIADALSLSEKTVKNHVTGIFRVLDVINRTQAVLAAKQRGIFSK